MKGGQGLFINLRGLWERNLQITKKRISNK